MLRVDLGEGKPQVSVSEARWPGRPFREATLGNFGKK